MPTHMPTHMSIRVYITVETEVDSQAYTHVCTVRTPINISTPMFVHMSIHRQGEAGCTNAVLPCRPKMRVPFFAIFCSILSVQCVIEPCGLAAVGPRTGMGSVPRSQTERSIGKAATVFLPVCLNLFVCLSVHPCLLARSVYISE